MMSGYSGFGLGGGGMGVGTLLFWGLIAFGAVMLVRAWGGLSGASEPGVKHKTALELLAERYALGEIDKSEFEQKRSDLRKN